VYLVVLGRSVVCVDDDEKNFFDRGRTGISPIYQLISTLAPLLAELEHVFLPVESPNDPRSAKPAAIYPPESSDIATRYTDILPFSANNTNHLHLR
jgi:hypothetical protein